MSSNTSYIERNYVLNINQTIMLNLISDALHPLSRSTLIGTKCRLLALTNRAKTILLIFIVFFFFLISSNAQITEETYNLIDAKTETVLILITNGMVRKLADVDSLNVQAINSYTVDRVVFNVSMEEPDQDACTDYVFQDGYKVPPLKDVQEFIDKHGYLSNIPSAEKVTGNGFQLGEMNRLLLKKVEESPFNLFHMRKGWNGSNVKLMLS